LAASGAGASGAPSAPGGRAAPRRYWPHGWPAEKQAWIAELRQVGVAAASTQS